MRIFLTPTRSCPEYKCHENGWELTAGRPFGFESVLGSPPSPLENADLHYLGWVWVPREYWLGVTRSGDEIHVDGFGKYGYGVLREGNDDTGEINGRTQLNKSDILYVDPRQKEIEFRLRYE